MKQRIPVDFKRLPHGEGLPLPEPGTPESAGFDLSAALENEQKLAPGERALIPCGFSLALPSGFEAQIRPRSGLSLKYGLTILNSPGTIDADYRGEIKALLINMGQEAFTLTRGLRIAQLVIARCYTLEWRVVEELPSSNSRGQQGFGSTGLHVHTS